MREDDPNYQFYADGKEEQGRPIRFYVEQAESIKQFEKTTLQVDFSHLASFPFNEPYFID